MIGRWEKAFMILASIWGVLRVIVSRPHFIVVENDAIGRFRHDPRMAKVYEWLESQHIRYADLVHATPGAHVVPNWFQRRGPIVYLEGVTLVSLQLLTWLMRRSGARQVWAIDDFRHWPRVVAAARRAGVPSVLFQHGRFTRHQIGTFFPDASYRGALPDAYIVWNKYWREKLLALSPAFSTHPEVVKIGGKPSRGQSFPFRSRSSAERSLHVVVVHEPAAAPADVRDLLDALLNLEGVTVFYKIRADQSEFQQLASLGLQEYPSRGLAVVPDIPDQASLILGSYSTLLYELIAQGIPVGIVATSSTQAQDLVQDGLAAQIDPDASDLKMQLSQAAQVSDAELERRAGRLAVTVDLNHTLDTLAKDLNFVDRD